MIGAQRELSVIANNLANVNTTGFKKDGISFATQFERTLLASGGMGRTLGELGSGPVEIGMFTEFVVGPTQHTGMPLDIAIQDTKGALAVETQQGIRYTRDGSLTLGPDLELITHSGQKVLDDRQQPISVPPGSTKISISETGDVLADGKQVGKIALYEGNFTKTGANLFTSEDAKPLDTIKLIPGALEGSNVNPVESMIQMISLQRAYELAQKSISQQDDSTQRLIQSLSERG